MHVLSCFSVSPEIIIRVSWTESNPLIKSIHPGVDVQLQQAAEHGQEVPVGSAGRQRALRTGHQEQR